MTVSDINGTHSSIALSLSTYGNPVTVVAGGIIAASQGQYALNAGSVWTVQNFGSIAAATGDGIDLNAGGAIINGNADNTGTISGGTDGIYIAAASGNSVANYSQIQGGTTGIVLLSGAVSNAADGTIAGNTEGILIASGPGTVVNAGSIYGYATNGVLMLAGGSVTNGSSGTIAGYKAQGIFLAAGGTIANAGGGTITGGDNGILAAGGVGAVTNAGAIYGTAYAGISLGAGGAVSNTGGGTIAGGAYGGGIEISGGPGTVFNAGAINGPMYDGVHLYAGGYVTNAGGGTITGFADGVQVDTGQDTVINAGSIYGYAAAGILLGAGGSVTNESGGTITGYKGDGVSLAAGGTVYNAAGGTISGGIAASGAPATVLNAGVIYGIVSFDGSGSDRLIIDGGSVFGGAITAYGANNTLELTGQDGGIAALPGYLGFQTVMIDSGAVLSHGGSLGANVEVYGVEQNGTVTSGGVVTVDGGDAELNDVASGGALVLISGAVEEITVLAGGNAFQFTGSTSGGTLWGGDETVLGGVTSGVWVESGGFQFAGNFNNGPAGGTLTDSVIFSGGVLALGVDGTAIDADVDGGALLQLAGTTSGVDLNGGGTQYVGGQLPGVPLPSAAPQPVAYGSIADYGGLQIVNANGSAIGTTVLSGGLAEVFAGGTASSAIVSSGGSFIVISGALSGITVEGGGDEYQFAGSTAAVTLSGGDLTTLGGVVNGITVESGGFEFAGTFNNGPAGGTVVDSEISSGGILATGVEGTVSGAVIASGGVLFELAGLTSGVVLSGGLQYVGGQLPGVPLPNPVPAAVASGTTVSSGGEQQVNSNGSAVNTSVLSGGVIVFNGGAVSGLSVSSGGVIDLAIFAYSSASSLSYIENAADIGGTLTVSNGTDSLTINLLGQYVAGGFQESQDSGTGTAISYNPAVTSNAELAAHHGAG